MDIAETFLTIEKGEPFKPGTKIVLTAAETFIGRASQTHRPNIAFSSQYISRLHAVINTTENQHSITDLNSKHGTKINDHELDPRQAYQLQHGDRISFAKETVIMVMHKLSELDPDETINFISPQPAATVSTGPSFQINPERREIVVDGELVQLFGKDLDLLLLLYQHMDRAVSYSEIKKAVWPERLFEDNDGTPDVGGDEITALVYRLRKRLGRYGECIKSIPRYGYILDIRPR